MKMVVCSIYDKATEAYMRPFFCHTEGEAMREFTSIANDLEHPVGRHPEDYALFRIGSFNDSTGDFDSIENRCLARAHEIQQKISQIQKVSEG